MKLFSSICAVTILGVVAFSFFSSEETGNAAEVNQVAYLCNESKELVFAPVQPTPAVHPETGQRTLSRALYCKVCDRWQAAPSSDRSSGNPLNLRCQKHNTPLTADGPTGNSVKR